MSESIQTPRPFPNGRDRWPSALNPERKMSLGVMIPISEGSHFGGLPRFKDMLECTRVAQDVGFDVAWFADHLVIGHSDDLDQQRGVWECYTVMSGVAAATDRIHLGSLVSCVSFRSPGLLAKVAESLDEISGGRSILGLGAGWHEPEYRMFGYPFDHRVSRFEEAVQVLHPLLRGETVTHNGTYFENEACINRPVGPRPGGIPIVVGTSGPRMLRISAGFADAWNTVWHTDPAEVVEKMKAVDAACVDAGRDPSTLVRTAGGNIGVDGYTGVRPSALQASPVEVAQRLRDFQDIGMAHYVVGLDPCTPKSLESFARTIELFDAA